MRLKCQYQEHKEEQEQGEQEEQEEQEEHGADQRQPKGAETWRARSHMKSSEEKRMARRRQAHRRSITRKRKPRGEAITEPTWPSFYRTTDRQEETRHGQYYRAPCFACIEFPVRVRVFLLRLVVAMHYYLPRVILPF